jgi:TolB-like protein
MPGGAKPSVYAVKSELDAWRHSRLGGALEADADAELRSVAVLPFLNLTSDREDQYFADGLADEIITTLSRLPSLHVTARTSSFALRGQEKDIREVGRRLNASAVIEGAVQRSGHRVRISIQLIDASHGYHLWSERFDREFADVFALQDEITGAIVDALRVRLTHVTVPVRRAGTTRCGNRPARFSAAAICSNKRSLSIHVSLARTSDSRKACGRPRYTGSCAHGTPFQRDGSQF